MWGHGTTNWARANRACGGANCGVLVMLKTSVRKCKFSFSVRFVFLCSEKSSCLVPASRSPERVRPTLPKANAGGLKNCEASIQRSGVGCGSAALTPVQLGRCPPPCEHVLFVA